MTMQMMKRMERMKMDNREVAGQGMQLSTRKALIDAVHAIWGADSEMVYLVLWMWGSGEASGLSSPEEAKALLGLAAAGPGSGSTATLRKRLRVLHEHRHPELSLAA